MKIFAFLFTLLSTVAQADFKFRINEDLGTLDWGYGEVNVPVVQQLMEGLTLSGPKGEAVPAIASGWTTKNNTRFVFTLRPNAKWSDGKRVCSQHFVDAWKRVLSPEFASPYAHLLKGLKGVRADGCSKLVVELEKPAVFFPALASHWVLLPVRLDLIEKHGKKWTDPKNLVVTGPYVLETWKRDQRYVLKRNPEYFGKPAHEERIHAVVVSDDATALNLFEKGSLDWIRDVPLMERTRLASAPEYRLFQSFVSYHIGFNHASPALSRDERCALAQSIDKTQIAKLLRGGEKPAWTISHPLLSKVELQPAYNPEAARKLWGSSKKKIELRYYSKDVHNPLMELVQEHWRKHLGVQTNLIRTEGKTYWSQLHKNPPAMFLSGTTAAFAHPYSFYSEFLSDSAANWGHYSSKTYDDATLKIAKLAPGPALKAEATRAERQILERDCAVIPLYFRQTAALVSSKWAGFQINPMTYVYLKAVQRKR